MTQKACASVAVQITISLKSMLVTLFTDVSVVARAILFVSIPKRLMKTHQKNNICDERHTTCICCETNVHKHVRCVFIYINIFYKLITLITADICIPD